MGSILSKVQTPPPPPSGAAATTTNKLTPPEVVVNKPTSDASAASEVPTNIVEELARLRELLEENLAGQTEHTTTGGRPAGTSSSSRQRRATDASSTATTEVHHDTQLQAFSQNINERVTDLQLSVTRLHQDVTAIRQVLERASPLSTSLILGRTTGRK
jgi:hypothetical protein